MDTHGRGECWEGCCGKPRAQLGIALAPTPPRYNTPRELASKSDKAGQAASSFANFVKKVSLEYLEYAGGPRLHSDAPEAA